MNNRLVTNIFSWLLISPAFLAIIYIDGLLYPYVVPKTLLFRGFGILSLAIFSYLILSRYSFYWGRLKDKLTWLPGILLLVAYITSFLGIDFYHSFWSTFDRGDGLLTLSICISSFYLILLYADEIFFKKLLKVIVWVGMLVALYAFLQWVQGFSGVSIPLVEEPSGRIGGTFGNAAYLASYLAMTLFATFMFIPDAVGRLRRVIQISAVLQVVVIFLTATRGTILALLIVGLGILMYQVFQKNDIRIRKYARIVLVVVIICAGLFFMFREKLSESSYETISRIASISVEDGTVASRLFVWKEVFSEAMKNPLIGHGAEHIDVLFDAVYAPDKIKEEWFDKSHNLFLDYFVQYGIFGLILYLAVIFTLGFLGWRMWVFGDKKGLYVMAIAVVYAIQNFFIFDTAITLWLFFIITAGTLAISSDEKPTAISLFPYARLVGFIGAGLIFILIIPISLSPLRANMFLAEGYKYHISDPNKAIEKMEKGLSMGTYADLEYGYQVYVMYTERQVNMLVGEERVSAYKYALNTLTKNLEKYPYDARTATFLAHVIDLAPPEIERDEVLLKEVIDKALELSPKRSQLWFLEANIYIRKGNVSSGEEKILAYKEAVSIIGEYTRLLPENSESRYILANLYLVIGNRKEATSWAEEGLTLYKGNKDTANRAMSYYIAIEDWEHTLIFSRDIVEKTPGNYELMYDLAKLYYLTGDYEKSLELTNTIKKEKPGLVETDQEFLHALGEIQTNSL